MFGDLLDVRLTALRMAELDDATSYTEECERAEGAPKWTHTHRSDARRAILFDLTNLLGIVIDKTPFRVPDEAASSQALKAWLTANWQLIEAKCAEKRADPNRELPSLMLRTWDASVTAKRGNQGRRYTSSLVAQIYP